ncbi:MAG: aminopeptidase [Bacilli bacterium]|nr:aminopeptidase [Bacilli bacterium]
MLDPRLTELADVLINYSVDLEPGENVWIDAIGIPTELVNEIVKAAFRRGGYPYVHLVDPQITRTQVKSGSRETFRKLMEVDRQKMQQMQAYIGVRGGLNAAEMAGLDPELQSLYQAEYNHKVHTEVRVKHTKWVVLRYPTPSMAQSANMSTELFEDFYFQVCTLDYKRMAQAMEPLLQLMQTTDQVHIKGPGTDLSFSIRGIGAVMCCGRRNLPDGEVYSAPIRDSVQGTLAVNTSSIYRGVRFEQIKFRFEQGRIVEASANHMEQINRVLNTDEGARYIGEFSIAVNPYILLPMNDTLFDEKIAGSFHFTPGQCYDRAYNGNHSAIHWDLVTIQRPEFGGGEIWFDNRLIRKDGRFLIPELEGLNPEYLVTKGAQE